MNHAIVKRENNSAINTDVLYKCDGNVCKLTQCAEYTWHWSRTRGRICPPCRYI